MEVIRIPTFILRALQAFDSIKNGQHFLCNDARFMKNNASLFRIIEELEPSVDVADLFFYPEWVREEEIVLNVKSDTDSVEQVEVGEIAEEVVEEPEIVVTPTSPAESDLVVDETTTVEPVKDPEPTVEPEPVAEDPEPVVTVKVVEKPQEKLKRPEPETTPENT